MSTPVTKTSDTVSLVNQTWRTLCVDGKTYLTKGIFTDDYYSILVTDLGSIWEENINEQQLLERSKDLNQYIEVPASVILHQLSLRILNSSPILKCSYTISSSINDQLTISTIGPLNSDTGPQYKWNFNPTRAPSVVLKNHLSCPLLSMTVELLRQQKELISIINKKEKEINDYKENGAVISRAHLITTPFEETSFNNQMITSKKFEEISMNPFEYVTDGSWDKLYSDVTSCSIWSSTKAACSPITSPVKSTQKRIIITSPSKDTEFKRRKELMKQLEDDKSKSKKKKKKLM